MDMDYTVKVEVINRETGEKIYRVFPFTTYANNVSFDLKQVLHEVEEVFLRLEGFKDRDSWSEESKESFMKIRKRLLNNINNVQRLPETLCYKGVSINNIPASELLANIIDKT